MECSQDVASDSVAIVPPDAQTEFDKLVQGVVAEHVRQTKYLESEIVRLQSLLHSPASVTEVSAVAAPETDRRDCSKEIASGFDEGNEDAPNVSLRGTPLSRGINSLQRQDSDLSFGQFGVMNSSLPSEPRISERVAETLTMYMEIVRAPTILKDRVTAAILWFGALEEPQRSGRCYQLINSKFFHSVIMLAILVNSWCIISESDLEIQRSLSGAQSHPEISRFITSEAIEIAFASFYAIEWTLRLSVHRLYFFVNADRWWNIMDTVLVLLACYELRAIFGYGSQDLNFTYMRLFRLLKVVRGFRLMRELRLVREMRLMLDCVLNSAGQLFLCTVLVLYVLCMFSVIFVQLLADFIALNGRELDSIIHERVSVYFGSVPKTMVSLYMATTGGSDWEQQYSVFHEAGWGATALYLFFISFFVVVVWNIVMSTFVEKALQLALPDIDTLMADKQFRDARDAKEICNMIRSTVDDNGDGLIHLSEFVDHVNSPEFQDFLQIRGFDCKSAISFFDMLKSMSAQEDAVDIETFVACCLRLQGVATSIDLQTLRFEIKKMYYKQKQTMNRLEAWFTELSQQVVPTLQQMVPSRRPSISNRSSRRSSNRDAIQLEPVVPRDIHERDTPEDMACHDVQASAHSTRL